MKLMSPAEAISKLVAWSKDSPAVSVIYGGLPSLITGWGRLEEVSQSRVTILVKGKQTSLSGEQEITAEITFEASEIVAASGSSVFEAPEHLKGKMAMAFDESIQFDLVSGRSLVLYKPASAPQS